MLGAVLASMARVPPLFILLGLAVVLCIVVIVLIDNTIRLAMFSNRFLIKTMESRMGNIRSRSRELLLSLISLTSLFNPVR